MIRMVVFTSTIQKEGSGYIWLSDCCRFQAMATKITATCYKNYISVWSLSCGLAIETVGIDENSSDMIQS
ncbi:hypothetical protein LINGRAHAP2_LOCUS26996 [Linum grandiflorum]